MRSVGLPELVVLAVTAIPLVAAVWLLVMVSAIRRDVQEVKELRRREPAAG